MIIEIYNRQLPVGNYKIILTDALTGKEFAHIVELYSSLESTVPFDFNVVIVNELNIQDALTESASASRLNALVLLTYTNYMPKSTIEYIKSNLKKEGTVYLLGGTG